MLHIIFKRLSILRQIQKGQIWNLWVRCAEWADVLIAALNQAVRQAARKTFCFPCSLNLGQAVVLVFLYCKILHVSPLNCYLPIMWVPSNITKDENENSELAVTFCVLSFFFSLKNVMHGVMSGLQVFEGQKSWNPSCFRPGVEGNEKANYSEDISCCVR